MEKPGSLCETRAEEGHSFLFAIDLLFAFWKEGEKGETEGERVSGEGGKRGKERKRNGR